MQALRRFTSGATVSMFVAVLLVLPAVPASAIVTDYRYADQVVRSNTSGDNCHVRLRSQRDYEVHLWCNGTGWAWTRWVIRGIEGRVRKVTIVLRRDCNTFSGGWNQRGTRLIGKDKVRGTDFDCYLQYVRVRNRR